MTATNPELAAELLAAVRDEAAGEFGYWSAYRAHGEAEMRLRDLRLLAVNDLNSAWVGPRPEVPDDIAGQLLAATVEVARAAAEMAEAEKRSQDVHGGVDRLRDAIVAAYDIGWPTGG